MTATYLLWCLHCTPTPEAGNAQPFDSPQARGKWAAQHRAAHAEPERWYVLDIPGR